MLFLPCSMRCSFRPMAGSYLETVCSHVRWKGACANLRRQTSSVITGNNNSHDKWCDQHVTSTEQRKNLSPQQELNLWPSVHRSDALTGWATKDSCELSHFQGSCDVFVYGPARHKPIVAQWLEYLSGERKVSGSIPLGDSDFFFCPVLVTCWSQRFSLFSSRNLKSTIFLYLSQQ